MFTLRHDVWGVQSGIICLVRRPIAHFPEETALWIRGVGGNIQGSFCRVKASDDLQAGLIHSTFWFFSVLERNTDLKAWISMPMAFLAMFGRGYLITEVRSLVFPQGVVRLGEVVLDQVEESGVVFFRYTRIMQEEGAIRDQRICCLEKRRGDFMSS